MIGQRMYPIIMIKKLENPANFSGDENASNLGVISPKIRSSKVIRIISKIITMIVEVFGKRFSPITIATKAAKDEAATFTIVFPKRMIIKS